MTNVPITPAALSQHSGQDRVYRDGSVALFGFNGDFFTFPHTAADVDSAVNQIQALNMPTERFAPKAVSLRRQRPNASPVFLQFPAYSEVP